MVLAKPRPCNSLKRRESYCQPKKHIIVIFNHYLLRRKQLYHWNRWIIHSSLFRLLLENPTSKYQRISTWMGKQWNQWWLGKTRRNHTHTKPWPSRRIRGTLSESLRLRDLVRKLEEGKSSSLSDIIAIEKQNNKIGPMFTWFDTLKIKSLSAIEFILSVVC